MAGKLRPHPRRPPSPRDALRRHPCISHTNGIVDDTRRSGRANKGKHTKNRDVFDEPALKSKSKGKPDKNSQTEPVRAQSAQSGGPPEEEEQEEEEDDAYYRCVCGDQREIRGREMIMCDKCEAWQHNKCLNLPDSSYWEDKTYLCEVCEPDAHRELLDAIERGEKPWNRKKGAKAAAPKYRPNWGGASEATATPEKIATPTPQAPKAQLPAPAAVPTPSPASAPVTAPEELPREPPSGLAEDKPSKKPSPRAHAVSPTREKRSHDAIADKETTQAKRRKSSAQSQEKSAPQSSKEATQTAVAKNVDDLPDKQRLLVKKLVESLSASVKEASESREYRIPDGDTPTSMATKLALQIDFASVTTHGAPTDNLSPYVTRIRSILHNTKSNVILVDRLLDGSLSPAELASMPPEEMASEDKQKEYAAIRVANEKQMVLTEETGPRLRKTHKGEEIVGEDDVATEPEYRPPEHHVRDSAEEGVAGAKSPKQEQDHPVELPEDVAGRSALSLDTTAESESVRRPSTNFDINSVFEKVRSPQHDHQAFLHRRQSSIRAQQTPQQAPIDDADVDRLLKDEDNDVEMAGYASDPTIVWRGSLDMQQLGPFDAVARFVAGGDFGQRVPWDHLLQPSLPIAGRIENQRGNDYIQGLAASETHDVAVLTVSPVTMEGKAVFDQLFEYFEPRNRWGVVPVDSLNNGMRDLYVIPIAGHKELPHFVNMLEYCTLETPRQDPMILLALVAKLPDATPQLPPSQHFETYPATEIAAGQVAQPIAPTNGHINGPSPSPIVNPHGPLYSPVQPSFPSAPNFGQPSSTAPVQNGNPISVPIHHQYRNAIEIFGPFIDAPVVQTLLKTPNMSDDILRNLAHIMQEVPAARTDFTALTNHMAQKDAANQQNQQQQPVP
jgi:hypothetical protein